MWPLLFHGLSVVLDGYYLHRAQQSYDARPQVSWGGLSQFLTQWGHVLHLVFFVLAVVNDIRSILFRGKSKTKEDGRLTKFLDYFFFSLFSLSSLVGVAFWSIFFYDRNLIFSVEMEKFYAKDLNLYQHGITAVLVWIELVVVRHVKRNLTLHVVTWASVPFTYLIWMNVLNHVNGMWPYLLQRVLSFKEHVCLVAAMIFFAFVVFWTGLVLSEYLWSGKKSSSLTSNKIQKKRLVASTSGAGNNSPVKKSVAVKKD